MEKHNINFTCMKTLIIDNYDSYTFNLLQFFDSEVVVIRNDQFTWQEFSTNILPHFDNVLISPGPGRPEKDTDFGICTPLIEAQMDPQQIQHHRPIFGICLGHQGIGHLFGGNVIYAPRIMHGRMSEIHCRFPDNLSFGNIFHHCTTPFWAVRYHSLVVDPASLPDCLEITAYCEENDADIDALKNSTYISDEDAILTENQRFHYLDHSSSTSNVTHNDKSITIMGFQHKDLPLWGVQFHPESVSTEYGQTMIDNFAVETYKWMLKTGRPMNTNKLNGTIKSISVAIPKSIKVESYTNQQQTSTTIPPSSSTSSYELYIKPCFPTWVSPEYMAEELFNGNIVNGLNVSSVSWLDSSRKSSPYSQVSILSVDPSFIIRYSTLHKQINIQSKDKQPSTLFLNQQDTFFDYISRYNEQFGQVKVHRCSGSNIQRQHNDEDENDQDFISSRLAFKGGFTGYFGYEMKRESMDGYITPNEQQCNCTSHHHLMESISTNDNNNNNNNENNDIPCCDCMIEPDAAFHFVDKYWLFDHQQQKTYVCCLVNKNKTNNDYNNIGFSNEQEAYTWMTLAEKMILHTVETIRRRQHVTNDFDSLTPSSSTCTTPIPKSTLLDQQPPLGSDLFTANVQHDAYIQSIEECIHQIKEGEAYEICLTTRFRLSLPQDQEDDNMDMDHLWQLYTRYLRKNNPAPFSALIQFPKSQSSSSSFLPAFGLLSSSPERFLKVEKGIAEMKPIKGTVARVLHCVCPDGTCDFGSICDSFQLKEDNLRKQQLWEDVKERAENLMIVDLIRNDLAQVCYPSSVQVPKLMHVETYEKVHHLVSTIRGNLRSQVNAVDALRKCFPPGSMTGAPKLRSVQLLDQLENNKRRGAYSGCLGYLSLDGNADFNVVIRTAIITKKSNNQVELSVGGGGAITFLSNPEQEWKEALLKTKSVAPSVKQYLEDHY
ncbi:ADC synthase [Cunninghamella echinulata]|nr:ADC synthase [Cunninghamella echinulata]